MLRHIFSAIASLSCCHRSQCRCGRGYPTEGNKNRSFKRSRSGLRGRYTVPQQGWQVYRKELFSVYLDGPAETGSAAGGKMTISGGFSVYPATLAPAAPGRGPRP